MAEKALVSDALVDKLQLWGFEGDVMIFNDFTLGCGLSIRPIDVSCHDNDAINVLKFQLVNFLNALDAGLRVQFVQNVVTGSETMLTEHSDLVRSDTHSLYKEMTEERVSILSQEDSSGLIPRQELMVFIRSPLTKKWVFRLFCGKQSVVS